MTSEETLGAAELRAADELASSVGTGAEAAEEIQSAHPFHTWGSEPTAGLDALEPMVAVVNC